jgi:hypothetical protein
VQLRQVGGKQVADGGNELPTGALVLGALLPAGVAPGDSFSESWARASGRGRSALGVLLLHAALAYAAVANLNPSDLRWPRQWVRAREYWHTLTKRRGPTASAE